MSKSKEPGIPIFYRNLELTSVKSVDTASRTVSVVASTQAIDAHNEVVEQSWDLSRFLSNPVILWNHNKSELPIGKGSNISISNPGSDSAALEMDIVFASEKANPKAEQVLQLFEEGIQKAVSVGFIPGNIRWEEVGEKEVVVLSDNMLLEVSATPIGANPEALSKSLNAEKEFLKQYRALERDNEQDMENEANEKLELALSALEQKTKELQDKLEVSNQKVESLKERCSILEESRNEQQKKADELLLEITERDLSDLVGKKITPAEKKNLLRLAQLDRELYEDHLQDLKARPDMVQMKRVMAQDPSPPNSHLMGSDNGGMMHNEIVAISRG